MAKVVGVRRWHSWLLHCMDCTHLFGEELHLEARKKCQAFGEGAPAARDLLRHRSSCSHVNEEWIN